MIKLTAGSTNILSGHGSTFRAIVIDGQAITKEGAAMQPGSYLSSEESVQLTCASDQACVLYVRAAGTFDVGAD